MLDYDNFTKLTRDPKVIDPARSKWIPADGRSIVNSELARITKESNAPDLRGRFLRGLNIIYGVKPPPLDLDKADPDGNNRRPGEYQPDAFRLHNHELTDPGHTHPVASGFSVDCGSKGTPGGELTNGSYGNGDKNVHPAVRNTTGISLRDSGDSETRPKNVAVYYYIKIN